MCITRSVDEADGRDWKRPRVHGFQWVSDEINALWEQKCWKTPKGAPSQIQS